MPKVTVATDSVKLNYEIDAEQTFPPQLTVSNGMNELKLYFTSEQYRNYSKGQKNCLCHCQDGNEYFVTSLSK